jgi:hypothetical protein
MHLVHIYKRTVIRVFICGMKRSVAHVCVLFLLHFLLPAAAWHNGTSQLAGIPLQPEFQIEVQDLSGNICTSSNDTLMVTATTADSLEPLSLRFLI